MAGLTLWEYKVVVLEGTAKDHEWVLKAQGKLGWELVTVSPLGLAYMKREVSAGDASRKAKPDKEPRHFAS